MWFFYLQIGLNCDSEMDELDFTEDEVREGLAQLGYYNVPAERIQEFKKGNGSLALWHFDHKASDCEMFDHVKYGLSVSAPLNAFGHLLVLPT